MSLFMPVIITVQLQSALYYVSKLVILHMDPWVFAVSYGTSPVSILYDNLRKQFLSPESTMLISRADSIKVVTTCEKSSGVRKL